MILTQLLTSSSISSSTLPSTSSSIPSSNLPLTVSSSPTEPEKEIRKRTKEEMATERSKETTKETEARLGLKKDARNNGVC